MERITQLLLAAIEHFRAREYLAARREFADLLAMPDLPRAVKRVVAKLRQCLPDRFQKPGDDQALIDDTEDDPNDAVVPDQLRALAAQYIEVIAAHGLASESMIASLPAEVAEHVRRTNTERRTRRYDTETLNAQAREAAAAEKARSSDTATRSAAGTASRSSSTTRRRHSSMILPALSPMGSPSSSPSLPAVRQPIEESAETDSTAADSSATESARTDSTAALDATQAATQAGAESAGVESDKTAMTAPAPPSPESTTTESTTTAPVLAVSMAEELSRADSASDAPDKMAPPHVSVDSAASPDAASPVFDRGDTEQPAPSDGAAPADESGNRSEQQAPDAPALPSRVETVVASSHDENKPTQPAAGGKVAFTDTDEASSVLPNADAAAATQRPFDAFAHTEPSLPAFRDRQVDSISCAACGAVNMAGSLFCGHCRHPLHRPTRAKDRAGEHVRKRVGPAENAGLAAEHLTPEKAQTCQICAYRNLPDARFCGWCGAVLFGARRSDLPEVLSGASMLHALGYAPVDEETVVCQHCNYESRSDATFCGRCGAGLPGRSSRAPSGADVDALEGPALVLELDDVLRLESRPRRDFTTSVHYESRPEVFDDGAPIVVEELTRLRRTASGLAEGATDIVGPILEGETIAPAEVGQLPRDDTPTPLPGELQAIDVLQHAMSDDGAGDDRSSSSDQSDRLGSTDPGELDVRVITTMRGAHDAGRPSMHYGVVPAGQIDVVREGWNDYALVYHATDPLIGCKKCGRLIDLHDARARYGGLTPHIRQRPIIEENEAAGATWVTPMPGLSGLRCDSCGTAIWRPSAYAAFTRLFTLDPDAPNLYREPSTAQRWWMSVARAAYGVAVPSPEWRPIAAHSVGHGWALFNLAMTVLTLGLWLWLVYLPMTVLTWKRHGRRLRLWRATVQDLENKAATIVLEEAAAAVVPPQPRVATVDEIVGAWAAAASQSPSDSLDESAMQPAGEESPLFGDDEPPSAGMASYGYDDNFATTSSTRLPRVQDDGEKSA